MLRRLGLKRNLIEGVLEQVEDLKFTDSLVQYRGLAVLYELTGTRMLECSGGSRLS